MSPAKTERKVIRVGGSHAVALPPHWLCAFNLKVGDVLDVIYDSVVIVKPKQAKLDPELFLRELEILTKMDGGVEE